MKEIFEIHDTLSRMGIVRSQYDYSKRWLGKSPSYFSMLKATNRTASFNVLAHLVAQLSQELQRYEKQERFGESAILRDRWAKLLGTQAMLRTTIKQRYGV